MHSIFSRKLLIVMILMFGEICGFSQTNINSSEVYGKWTKKNSPYIINNNIEIPKGRSLFVEKGVDIILNGYYIIEINGTFTAFGEKDDSIRFFPSENIRYWQGFNIKRNYMQLDNDSVFFFYVLVKNARKKDREHTIMKWEFGGAFNVVNFNRFKLINCHLSNNYSYEYGGAIYFENGGNESEIKFCEFENNQAQNNGGAIFLKKTHVTIFSNSFKNNTSIRNGGAIALINDFSTINQNILSYNLAIEKGGAIFIADNSKIKITNNILQKNRANGNGGALSCGFHSEVILQNNIIRKNYAQYYGGGIFVDDYSYPISISNNLILKNEAKLGSAIAVFNSQAGIYANTIVQNTSQNGSTIYTGSYVSSDIVNNIIYYNTTQYQIYIEKGSAPPFITSSCIQDGLIGVFLSDKELLNEMVDNIISKNPSFINLNEGNYQLSENSPCIDKGEIPEKYMNVPQKDIDGHIRIQNTTIDIGAYEYNLKK